MTHTTPEQQARLDAERALHRLREVAACWSALSDLLIPEADDLNIVNRQHFAALARLLSSEYPPGHEDDTAAYRLNSLCTCWSAVAGLLGEGTLSSQTRDQLACLGMLIASEQAEALRALDAAIQGRAQS